MDIENYFKDLTTELEALKNRVRHYIHGTHWQTDGEWKESVLRTVLKRHLPSNIGVGRGFIVKEELSSTQIDILLYDNAKPILFRDGDFVIITSDAVKGAIEVKTKLSQLSKLRCAVKKLSEIAEFVNPISSYEKNQFYGIYYYESPGFKTDKVLNIIQKCVGGRSQRAINCVSFGKDYFVRYWKKDYFSRYYPNLPNDPEIQGHDEWWYAYRLENKAPAYFIYNVIEHLCPEWAGQNKDLWYPEKASMIAKKFLWLPHQIDTGNG